MELYLRWLAKYEREEDEVVCPAKFVPVAIIGTGHEELGMARGKKHTAEQVVNLLRQIEVSVANGKTTALACNEAAMTEQTYYRWRKEYGGLKVDQARRLKDLELENSKLKRLVLQRRQSRKRLQFGAAQ